MFQASQQSGLLYAVKQLEGVALGARPPRAVQSAAAESLLQRLRAGDQTGVFSKAHARGLVAAAVAEQGCVGIDLEYRQPGRDIVAIARWLMGAPARDEASAYRAFTYREAYFKALGDWPSQALLRCAAGAEATDFRTPDGLNVRHEPAEEGFVLTLVWSGSGAARRCAP